MDKELLELINKQINHSKKRGNYLKIRLGFKEKSKNIWVKERICLQYPKNNFKAFIQKEIEQMVDELSISTDYKILIGLIEKTNGEQTYLKINIDEQKIIIEW